MNSPVSIKHYKTTSVPIMVDGKLCNVDYKFLPKALPAHKDCAGEKEYITIPTECVNEDGQCCGVLNRKIVKPNIKIIVIEFASIINLPKGDSDSNEIPDILYLIKNAKFEESDNKIELPDFEIDDLDQDLLDKLSVINLDQRSEPNGDTYGGPGEDITKNKQTPDEIIRSFIKVVQHKKAKKTIMAKTNLINPKKAVIEMMIRPHKIFEMKKFKKKRPQIYALIDTETSESWGYGDDGVFLNSFAETCVSMGVHTWRAHKLTKDFYLERNPDIGYKGERSHTEWAELTNIKKGSLILFVGDGCLGTSGIGDSGKTWTNKLTKDFADKYNPLWIHYRNKDNDCGCRPKKLTMKSGWDAYYGIENVNNLIPLINE